MELSMIFSALVLNGLVFICVSLGQTDAETASSELPDYVHGNVVFVPKEKQWSLLERKRIECMVRMITDPVNITGLYCNRTWDGAMCWPDTAAGSTGIQKCPNYVNMFNIEESATRVCLEDGTWFHSIVYNRSWTNYSTCQATIKDVPALTAFMKDHLNNIRLLYSIGYVISLVSLVVALVIMIFFKRLHCPRNTIHCNLFLSFALRAGITLLKDNILEGDLGLPNDVVQRTNGKFEFIGNGTHWECKLLFVLFHYAIGANYSWVLMEGLYLHMLIFVSVFSENSSIRWYIVLGWCYPLLFVIPWAILKATFDDQDCWNTQTDKPYSWVLRGSHVLTCLVNIIIFLNIVRVLFTKLRASNSQQARRKLAKSTLVLMPLFGVYYFLIITFTLLYDQLDQKVEVAYLYLEMFFTSFSGSVIALLFCFLNNEVKAEIRKRWERYKLMRFDNERRSSKNINTLMSQLSRNRHSDYSIQSNNVIKRDPLPVNGVNNVSREVPPNIPKGEDTDTLCIELPTRKANGFTGTGSRVSDISTDVTFVRNDIGVTTKDDIGDSDNFSACIQDTYGYTDTGMCNSIENENSALLLSRNCTAVIESQPVTLHSDSGNESGSSLFRDFTSKTHCPEETFGEQETLLCRRPGEQGD